jgi:hypothetical protein
MVPRCSDKIARVSSYSLSLTGSCFRVRGYHPLWPDFPDRSTNTHPITTTGLVPVRSPLLRESRLISIPPVTEMFQFTGFAPNTYGFSAGYLASQVGFPIRKSSGQSLFASSPTLIAGYHVLHRLLPPRHPPYALTRLTI